MAADGAVPACDRLTDLSEVPLEALVAEVETRTAWAPDLGLSPQACPRCSTASADVLGEWSRREMRFDCTACGLTLHTNGYERALENLFASRWRARCERRELAELTRVAR